MYKAGVYTREVKIFYERAYRYKPVLPGRE